RAAGRGGPAAARGRRPGRRGWGGIGLKKRKAPLGRGAFAGVEVGGGYCSVLMNSMIAVI
ncbi:MAG: hypothetical protein KIS63_22780, partial [Caldilineales bacterium]|nr:hypothetical protein [Caldilineales bacterium]